MSLLSSFFDAITKGADATTRGLEGVNRRLDAFNERMARQLRIDTATRDLGMAVRLERISIEGALEVAQMTHDTEKNCQDPVYRRAYEEAERLLGRDVPEPAIVEPTPIPAFAIRIGPDNEDIRPQVEERVAELRSTRAAFIAATRSRLLADPVLRRHFESAMKQTGQSHLLPALQLPTDGTSVKHTIFGPINHSSAQ